MRLCPLRASPRPWKPAKQCYQGLVQLLAFSPPWSLPAARQGLLLAARRTRLFGLDLALLLLLLLLLLGLSIRHASPCALLALLFDSLPFWSTRFIMQFPARFSIRRAFGLLQDGPRAA